MPIDYRELVDGDWKVELEWIGEGWEGDYDQDDPEDDQLLRFTVSKLVDGEFEDVEDASYCTRLTTGITEEEAQKALAFILHEVKNCPGSIKKRCEQLSWLNWSWLQDPNDPVSKMEHGWKYRP